MSERKVRSDYKLATKGLGAKKPKRPLRPSKGRYGKKRQK